MRPIAAAAVYVTLLSLTGAMVIQAGTIKSQRTQIQCFQVGLDSSPPVLVYSNRICAVILSKGIKRVSD